MSDFSKVLPAIKNTRGSRRHQVLLSGASSANIFSRYYAVRQTEIEHNSLKQDIYPPPSLYLYCPFHIVTRTLTTDYNFLPVTASIVTGPYTITLKSLSKHGAI